MNWDSAWEKRIHEDGSIDCNTQKKDMIINELWMRPHLIKAEKLEIGCGPCMHIRRLIDVCSEWGENYTGIDMSGVAVEAARKAGVHVWVDSIYTTGKGFSSVYNAFFLFDVLEHLEDHKAAASSIKRLAKEQFTVLINIPLYLSVGETFERPVNIYDVQAFLAACGAKDFTQKIYGINGLPYMFVEGFRK